MPMDVACTTNATTVELLMPSEEENVVNVVQV